MKDKTICIIIFALVFFLFGCETYSGMYAKLRKAGMSKSSAMYVICKKDNKDLSKCEKFAKTATNIHIYETCGGTAQLEKNELKFLKCLTNLK